MDKNRIRLLLNAEPFGFGPTAAIAALHPHLDRDIEEIAYIGSGHTLDLQRHLPYAKVYDQNQMSAQEQQDVLQHYDVLLTASDFDLARAAKQAGLKLCIYDPLSWYWKKFPTIAREADLYIAQDFFGVRSRLQKVFNGCSSYKVVPPIINICTPTTVPRQGVLLNLGGLQNPHWPLDEAVDYARTILNAVRRALPAGEKLIVATSKAIATSLDDPDVKTYSVEDMHALRRECLIAFMTPGLGNIFDAAADNVATIWLPPANDSQGQQADLMANHCADAARIDWKDINPDWAFNYAASQEKVLAQISMASSSLSKNASLQDTLQHIISKKLEEPVSAPRHLLDEFGQGGAQKAALAVTSFCRSLRREEALHA